MRTYQEPVKKTTKTSTLTAVAKPPEPQREEANDDVEQPRAENNIGVWLADDQAILNIFTAPRIEPRPHRNKDKEKRCIESGAGALKKLGLQKDNGPPRFPKHGGYYAVGVAGPAEYIKASSVPLRRLFFAALKVIQLKQSFVSVDDVVDVRRYPTPKHRRKMKHQLKNQLGDGSAAGIVFVQDTEGDKPRQALRLTPAKGGWTIVKHEWKGRGKVYVPREVLDLWAKDDHALGVWIYLQRNKKNGMIAVKVLLTPYNTANDNIHHALKRLFSLLVEMAERGLIIIDDTRHMNANPSKDETGESALGAKSIKGFYFHYRLTDT